MPTRIIGFAPIVLIASAMVLGATALAGEVNLRIQHPMGEQSTLHRDVLLPWAEQLSVDSEGRVDSVVFASMGVGGSPRDLYRQVRDGVVDAAWLPIDYAGDEFPRTRVFQLPTVHRGDAQATSRAMQELQQQLAADFSEVHLLSLYAAPGNVLHMRDAVVDAPSRLAGAKIKPLSKASQWLVDAWQAENPEDVPLRDIPQALKDNRLDGVLMPFSLAVPFRIPETVKYSHVGASGDRFGTEVHALIMNKNTYNSLPPDLKDVIDTSSGSFAALAVAMNERDEELARTAHTDARVGVVRLTNRRMERFDQAAQGAIDQWSGEAQSAGIQASQLLEDARRAVMRASQLQ